MDIENSFITRWKDTQVRVQLGMNKREWDLNISVLRCECSSVHHRDSITPGTAQLLSHAWTRCNIKWLSSWSYSTTLISSPQQFSTGFQLQLKLMMWCNWVMYQQHCNRINVVGNWQLRLQAATIKNYKNSLHLTTDSLTSLHQNVCIYVGKSVM